MNGRVCAIVDIDGTLVDTNYHHTVAWGRAFAEHGVRLPLWRIHRHNGMGGELLVASVAGEDTERRLGDAVRASESRHYGELIGEVAPLPGAADLLRGLHELGVGVILASSAKPEEVERYVELLDAGDHVDAFTSGGDVDRTKPEPDLIVVAMRKAESAEQFVMIGDTTWDAIAAGRAGVPAIGLLSGGFGEDELRAAGCEAVFAGADELAAHLDRALGVLLGVTPGTAGA
jgi:HAD superfamily hydrolase (TIGR01549 family)